MARRQAEENIELIALVGIGGYLLWPYIKGFIAPPAYGATAKAASNMTPATPPVSKTLPKTPAKAKAGTSIIIGDKSKPRGIRNNNPGNIRKSGSNWKGKIGNDGAFEVFDTPTNGIRAMMKLLLTYAATYKLVTVKEIVSRWAPTADGNNVPGYVTVVNKQGGLPAGAILDLSDKATMFKLVRGMIAKENGVSYVNYYSDGVLNAAWGAM